MTTAAGSGVEIVAIDTPALGDRSYLAHDGSVALVVDPQRDIDRVLALAVARGVRITHVVETHLHNDYVTGGLTLARLTGAAYHVNAADPVAFVRVPVKDGDVIEVSPVMSVLVMATPGHTFTHLAYALQVGGHPHAVFGSFCSATQAEGVFSTIGRERQVNPVLILDEERYVAETLAGLDAYPAYYAHMGPANVAGPEGPDLSPPRHADAGELRRRIEGRPGSRCAAIRSRTSPGWSRSAATTRSSSSTCGGTPSGKPRTSKGQCTSRCTTCPPAAASCPAASCGCTAKRQHHGLVRL